MDRLALQFRALMIDQPDDGVQVYGHGKGVKRHRLAETAQVVIVTQQVGQPVGVLDVPLYCADRTPAPVAARDTTDP